MNDNLGFVLDALPIEATGSKWGEQIYFSVPVKHGGDADARAELGRFQLIV
ncbi:MAG: hypothetical protein IH991_09485 [Planctomycetes bacterium]|nr:hypothetical protein [Planctomycetota bacterium]